MTKSVLYIYVFRFGVSKTIDNNRQNVMKLTAGLSELYYSEVVSF